MTSKKQMVLNKISFITFLIIVSSCSLGNNDNIKTYLNGKWAYEDIEEKDFIEFWFYKDNLLFYDTGINNINRRKYYIKSDTLFIFASDGTQSSLPSSAKIVQDSINGFQLIYSPDTKYNFKKIEEEVDSILFFTVEPNDILKNYFDIIYHDQMN